MVTALFVVSPSATEAVKAAVQLQQQLQEEPEVPLRESVST